MLVVFVVAIISGLFGALSGAGFSKFFRRFGIAILCVVVGFLLTFKWYSIFLLGYIGSFSIGYGIPDSTDEGSPLGAFWFKVFKGNHFLADVFTRTTIGLTVASSLLSIAIFRGNWMTFGILSSVIIMIFAMTPSVWNKTGSYRLFGRDLLWGETVLYFSSALVGLCQLVF
jgi:hypothetical protein